MNVRIGNFYWEYSDIVLGKNKVTKWLNTCPGFVSIDGVYMCDLTPGESTDNSTIIFVSDCTEAEAVDVISAAYASAMVADL